jgi:hypothetical protein
MGVRNHLFRTVLLLVLALGLGVAVAMFSSGERTRPMQSSSSLPVIEHQAGARLAKPLIRPAPGVACAPHGGCAHL